MKFGQKFGWPLLSPKFDGPKHHLISFDLKISARFCTTLPLNRKYLRKASSIRKRHCKLYGHSRTGKLNSVYFGPQTAKNRTGVLTHPAGGHQAGHYHAYSCLSDFPSLFIPVLTTTQCSMVHLLWSSVDYKCYSTPPLVSLSVLVNMSTSHRFFATSSIGCQCLRGYSSKLLH